MSKVGSFLEGIGILWIIGYSLYCIAGFSLGASGTYAMYNPVVYFKTVWWVLFTPVTWLAIGSICLGAYLKK